MAYLKRKDPAHPGYINLLPTYATASALGTETYEEYVRRFAEKVKPFVLSYDHYALTNAGDRADFFPNLETVRAVSLDTNIPFWNIVLVTQHFDYRHLTEAELRFEAMQTLAFGAGACSGSPTGCRAACPRRSRGSTRWSSPTATAR